MKRKICIVSYTDLDKDPRPRNQIKWLKEEYEVTSIGTNPSIYDVEFLHLNKLGFVMNFLRIALLLKLRLYNLYYWDKHKKALVKQLAERRFDLIVVHEIRLLPLALTFSNGAKVILDAHEYSPENFNDNFIWRFFIRRYYVHLCEKYIKKADIITTVSDGIANLYRQNFDTKVEVINSAAQYAELKPKKVSDKKIRIIHHGICSSSRKLELMIEAAASFDTKFELNLMLVVSKSSALYFKKLKKLAGGLQNVKFLEPVKSADLVSFCNDFDISLSFFPPSNRNLEFALPNKFFEAIQSRIMCVTGPSLEMMKMMDKHGFGLTSKTFEPSSLAELINTLNAETVFNCKLKADSAAHIISAHSEGIKFRRITKLLLMDSVNS